ncbi:MAG: sigma-70 family RNA polymerase sigma factor [Oscillospiraceae bacterium]|nr:sigma-70 family RNA polymerase sigma factor [Oscillospiraceae bacterium]
MAEKKEYWLYVQDTPVAVSREVYQAYYSGKRQEKTQTEKDARHGVVSYHALDRVGASGEEWAIDNNAPAVEDAAMHRILYEELHKCLDLLPDADLELLNAIYFEGLTERQFAARMGIHYMTVHNCKVRILHRLKKMMRL